MFICISNVTERRKILHFFNSNDTLLTLSVRFDFATFRTFLNFLHPLCKFLVEIYHGCLEIVINEIIIKRTCDNPLAGILTSILVEEKRDNPGKALAIFTHGLLRL